MKKGLLFICCCCLCLCTLKVQADITLAVIAPKTGKYAAAGYELFEGARLAAKELNDNGGVNGEKLDMLTIDDRCDDRLALSTAEMLIRLKSKKIGLVVGPYCSNQFEKITSIYEKAKIFHIVPTTEAYHTGSADKKGNILLLGSKVQMSRDFFKFYNNNYAGLKVGFVYNGKASTGYTDVAKSLSDEFRRFKKADLLKFYMLNAEYSDIGELVHSVVKDKVHVVFVLADEEEVYDFVRAVKKKDKDMIVFTSKKMISSETLEDLGKYAEGLYVLELPGLKDSLMFTESLVNLRLLGIEPKGLETYSYLAVKLWGDLARQVNSFNYNKLSQAANTDALKEKWGDFLMHSGRHDTAKYIIEVYKDNSFKQVY